MCQLCSNFAIGYGKQIHAAQVPGLAMGHFAIYPAHHGAIATHDDLFGFESRVRVSVGRGRSVFKDGALRQQGGQRARIVTVESFVESIDSGPRGLSIPMVSEILMPGHLAGGWNRQ
jgi:hypothetical protein